MQENNNNAVTTECYAFTKNGDSILMQLNLNGQHANGTLDYNLKEKDRNKGTFNGTMKDDTLIADYTFSSEGMQSVRQVAFVRNQNDLVEWK